MRSILQNANEPALLQMIEKELESEKALENLLTDIPDLSLLDGLSLDLETALAALQQAEPDEGISDHGYVSKTRQRGVQSAKRPTR